MWPLGWQSSVHNGWEEHWNPAIIGSALWNKKTGRPGINRLESSLAVVSDSPLPHGNAIVFLLMSPFVFRCSVHGSRDSHVCML